MNSPNRIRLARRHAGLSQAQLALKVGVQRSAVGHWESVDGKNPSVTHLRAIAVETGVQFEWLATGRGAMHLSHDLQLDSISAIAGLLLEDDLEMRLIRAFRDAPPRARVLLVELADTLAGQRTRRYPGRTMNRDAETTGG